MRKSETYTVDAVCIQTQTTKYCVGLEDGSKKESLPQAVTDEIVAMVMKYLIHPSELRRASLA